MDTDGRVLETEQIYKEYLEEDEEVTVYNFQVEDWHTYHVGEMEVLVHNAEYESGSKTAKEIIGDRVQGFDLEEHPISNKQLSSSKMKELKNN